MAKKRKKVLKELDPKVKEIKKEKEETEEEDKEEELEQYSEDFWKEILHEEEREKEDAFNPEGLILQSGQSQENLQQRLENSPSEQQISTNAPGNMGKMYAQGSNPGDMYGDNQEGRGGDMYNQGEGGNLYETGQENSSMYGVNEPAGTGNKMYGGNIGMMEESNTDSRKSSSSLETTTISKSDKKIT